MKETKLPKPEVQMYRFKDWCNAITILDTKRGPAELDKISVRYEWCHALLVRCNKMLTRMRAMDTVLKHFSRNISRGR